MSNIYIGQETNHFQECSSKEEWYNFYADFSRVDLETAQRNAEVTENWTELDALNLLITEKKNTGEKTTEELQSEIQNRIDEMTR